MHSNISVLSKCFSITNCYETNKVKKKECYLIRQYNIIYKLLVKPQSCQQQNITFVSKHNQVNSKI